MTRIFQGNSIQIFYCLLALYFTRGVLRHNHVPYHTVDKTEITLRMKTEDNTIRPQWAQYM